MPNVLNGIGKHLVSAFYLTNMFPLESLIACDHSFCSTLDLRARLDAAEADVDRCRDIEGQLVCILFHYAHTLSILLFLSIFFVDGLHASALNV